MTLIKKKLERVQLTDTKIDLEIPKKILDQIKYLCREISAVEWSGVLFYSIKEGSIKDPSKLKLKVENILPMHKGTSAYTEYSFDERVVNYMMDTPESDNWKMGHIHSHNNMGVYFSGTDWEELEDNSPNHNFYLSLIVNNRMEFCAKVSFIIESETGSLQYKAKDENGVKYACGTDSISKQKMVSYDCEITSPENTLEIEDSFKEKVSGIISTAKKLQTKTTSSWSFRNRWDKGSHSKHSDDIYLDSSCMGWDFQKEGPTIDEDDLKEQVFEDFAMFVINTGNDTSKYKDIEDVLDYYKTHNLTGNQLASKIIEKYPDMYKTFFKDTKRSETSDVFEEMTEGIIEILDTYKYLSNSRYNIKLLEAVVKRLQSMLEKFKSYEPNTSK